MISNIANMEEKESHLQRELVRAEKSLIFMQKEHAKILDGLHQEIQSLTQKCSGKVLRLSQLMDSNSNFRFAILSGHAVRCKKRSRNPKRSNKEAAIST